MVWSGYGALGYRYRWPSGSQSRSARMGGPDGPEGTILLSDRLREVGSLGTYPYQNVRLCARSDTPVPVGPSYVRPPRASGECAPAGSSDLIQCSFGHPASHPNLRDDSCSHSPSRRAVVVRPVGTRPRPTVRQVRDNGHSGTDPYMDPRWYPPVPRGSFGSGPPVWVDSGTRRARILGIRTFWYGLVP
jgi:hypothetical protein